MKKKEKNLDRKKCVLRLEAGDWEVCFQLLTEENSVNMKQLWVKKWCTKVKNRIFLGQESKGLDCRIKIWERLWTNALEIWYAYDVTLNCFWSLRAKSVSQYAILDGYYHSWYFCDFLEAFKQTHKVRPKTPRDLKESFWTTFTHFQQKAEKRVCVSENILTSISVTSNSVSFQRTFLWSSGSRFSCQPV